MWEYGSTDPVMIEGVPVTVRGRLREVIVISVPESTPRGLLDRVFDAALAHWGEEVLIVTHNIELLRLVPA